MTGGVVAVRPGASVTEVAQLMRDQDIGDVLVASGDDLVGVVTDRDIVLRAVAAADAAGGGGDLRTVTAGAVCTPDPVTVSPGDPLGDAARLMREHAVRRLPVVEDGLPVGIVTLADLAREQEPESVLADISEARPDR